MEHWAVGHLCRTKLTVAIKACVAPTTTHPQQNTLFSNAALENDKAADRRTWCHCEIPQGKSVLVGRSRAAANCVVGCSFGIADVRLSRLEQANQHPQRKQEVSSGEM